MTITVRLLALAGALLLPQKLSAQGCLAAPHAARGWLGVRAARTSLEQNLVGAELGVRVGRWVTVRAEADLVRLDEPTPARRRARAGVSVGSRESPLPVCLTVSGVLTRMGDLTILTIPIGIVAGWGIPLGWGRSSLTSYLEPRLAYRRAWLAGFHSVSAPFSLVGGSGLSLGRVYGGVDFEWAPDEGRSWAAGLRAAIGF